jgi:hypothetical protein
MEAIKFLEFLALELSVVVLMGAVLIAGLYQVVRDRVREARRQDQIVTGAS